MAKQGKAIEPKTKERVAELIGLGLTQEEVAGAKDISRASVDRIMSQPEYRKVAEDIRRARGSMKTEVASILRAGLTAVDSDGDPLHSVRQRAAELYAKNPEMFDLADEHEGEDDGMLPGVILTFPLTADTLAPSPQREKSTLPGDEPEAEVEVETPFERADRLAAEATDEAQVEVEGSRAAQLHERVLLREGDIERTDDELRESVETAMRLSASEPDLFTAADYAITEDYIFCGRGDLDPHRPHTFWRTEDGTYVDEGEGGVLRRCPGVEGA